MAGRITSLAALGVIAICNSGALAGEVRPETDASQAEECDDAIGGRIAPSARPELDPDVFFNQLVKRYRGLHFYRDTARLVQVTKHDGSETARVETEIGCEVRKSDLHVQTPASQARSTLGVSLPVRHSPIAREVQHRHNLWLAPHMALKFAEEPLEGFRAGVDEGFTATEAESVTIDDRAMVHVELRSGDGLSESCNAKFDLFVNPETMLVERIEGEQRLPGGGSFTTSLDITPHEAEGEEPLLK